MENPVSMSAPGPIRTRSIWRSKRLREKFHRLTIDRLTLIIDKGHSESAMHCAIEGKSCERRRRCQVFRAPLMKRREDDPELVSCRRQRIRVTDSLTGMR